MRSIESKREQYRVKKSKRDQVSGMRKRDEERTIYEENGMDRTRMVSMCIVYTYAGFDL